MHAVVPCIKRAPVSPAGHSLPSAGAGTSSCLPVLMTS